MGIINNKKNISLKSKYDILIVIDNDLNNLNEYNNCCSNCYSFSNITDFYQWIKSNKRLNNKLKIGFINNIKSEDTNDYVNLLEFYLYYKNVYKLCNKEIKKFNRKLKDDTNPIINEAINEFIRMNSDGKYIRAFLIALGYHTTGNYDNNYLPLAVAYEVFQTSILIHDDFMDEALTRRTKETIPVYYNKKYSNVEEKERSHFSNSLAICLGDLGFFYATKIISENYADNKNLSNILSLYSQIQMNTVKGQLLDIELPFINKYKKIDNIMDNVIEIYKYKTAWYSIIGPYLLGKSIITANHQNIIEPLENLGIAFQIKDDLLGIYQDASILGKDSNDISEFKQTILYAYIKENKPKHLKELLNYYGKKDLTIEDIEKVKQIINDSQAKEYALNKMHELFKKSKQKINKMKMDKQLKKILLGFITYLELREN